jgi:hypothetical protein
MSKRNNYNPAAMEMALQEMKVMGLLLELLQGNMGFHDQVYSLR